MTRPNTIINKFNDLKPGDILVRNEIISTASWFDDQKYYKLVIIRAYREYIMAATIDGTEAPLFSDELIYYDKI